MAVFEWTESETVTALRDTVGDPSNSATTRWSAAECDRYINRAMQVVVLDVPSAFETTWTAALVDGQREYEVPDEFIMDRTVEWVKGANDVQRLEYITWDEFQRTYNRAPQEEGDPAFYTYWRKLGASDETSYQPAIIYILPTPNAGADGDTIRIFGYKVPDDFDSTAGDNKVVEMERQYVEAVIVYAAHLMFTDDGDGPMSDRMRNRYENHINKILSMESKKTRSERSKLWPRDSIWTPQSTFRRRPIFPWERGY